MTKSDGTFVADVLRRRAVRFDRPGYKSAVVFFPDARPWVVSPMEDAGWRSVFETNRDLCSTCYWRRFETH